MTSARTSAGRFATGALVSGALLLATPALAQQTHAGGAPSARAARTISVTDNSKEHLISTSGELLNEEGIAVGGINGKVRSRLKIGATVSGTTTFYPKGGSITIRGFGTLHSSGVVASFGGSMHVISATGKYSHAHGSGGFFGVVNRRNWKITVQTTGNLTY